jgi:hypothetical protein
MPKGNNTDDSARIRAWAVQSIDDFCVRYGTRVLAELIQLSDAHVRRVKGGEGSLDAASAERVARLVAPRRLSEFVEVMSDPRSRVHEIELDQDGLIERMMLDARRRRLGLDHRGAAAIHGAIGERLGLAHPLACVSLLDAVDCWLEADDLEEARALVDRLERTVTAERGWVHFDLHVRRVRIALDVRSDTGTDPAAAYVDLRREADRALAGDAPGRDRLVRRILHDCSRMCVASVEHAMDRGRYEKTALVRRLDAAEQSIRDLHSGDRWSFTGAERALDDLLLATISRLRYGLDSRDTARYASARRHCADAEEYFRERRYDPRRTLCGLERARLHWAVEQDVPARAHARDALPYLAAVGHLPGQRDVYRLMAELPVSAFDRLGLQLCAWACCAGEDNPRTVAVRTAMTRAADRFRTQQPDDATRGRSIEALRASIRRRAAPFDLLPYRMPPPDLVAVLDGLFADD